MYHNTYNTYNEESSILGELVSGLFKKKEQKAAKDTETIKGAMNLILAKQQEKERKYVLEQQNKLKIIKIVAAVFGVVVISIAIIIAVRMKKNNTK